MRAFGTFILGILVTVAAIILVLFAVENTRSEQFSFLGNSFSVDLWLIAVIPAIVGFILALLLTTPAHAAIDAQQRSLGRRYRDLDREYAGLRQQHDALVSQHAALQAERDALHDEHSRLLATHQALQAERNGLTTERDDLRAHMAAASDTSHPAPRGEPARERDVEQVNERTPEPVVEQVDGRPRERVDQPGEQVARDGGPAPSGEEADEREAVHEGAQDRTPDQAPESQPTLGDRVRGWLRGSDRPREDYPDGTVAPTS